MERGRKAERKEGRWREKEREGWGRGLMKEWKKGARAYEEKVMEGRDQVGERGRVSVTVPNDT